uniref:Aminopeptidase n=1 Tax=Lepeophtheirus salmonis TaxID=72036 RepID=A0A0K2UDX1_LEPSM
MKIKLYFELSWSNSCNMSRLLLLLMWVVYCSGVKALDFRLPSHVVPKSYSIELNPEYEKTNNLFGVVKIEVMCVIDGSKNITLHAKNINITHMDIIDKVSGNNINITNSSAGEVGTDFVVIHLSTNLNIGSDYILTMNYTTIFIEPDDYEYDLIYDSNDETNDRTTLDDNTPYVYEDNTKGFMFNNGVYYTNMMPIYARTVFPCFDEPSFKSVFNITLRRPKNMISISNMPINQTITPGNSVDFVSDIFKSTPLMSTHLVAFVITNYTNETILSNNTQLRIWTPEDDKSKTCLAKSVSPTLYRYLNQYFGKNLPITKQDMITIPANISFNYIAMENWGLSTFQSEALLIEENVTSVSSLLSKDEIVLEISQMLTHQWMGDLVTISWWCDLWLTVGSTSYLSYLVSTKIFPDDRAWDIFLIFVFQEAMEKDSPLVPVTMKKIIRNNGEIPNGLDSLTYFKSASFIRMLSGIIGENDLHMVYRNLMAKYELKNIDEDLFWKEIDGVVSSSIKPSILNNMTMKALMGPWLTQAGYPVIHVSPNFENGSIQIYQENFNARDKVINNLWWVPLKYNIIDKNENGTIKLIWLNNTKMNQTFQDTDLKKSFPCLEPVVFNINQTGYYRVNYNDDNWKLITRYLRLNHSRIYKYNRAQLIDDSFSLAMEGFLSYLIPFKITTYLPNEDEPLIWITFFKKLLEITKIIFRIENNEKIKVGKIKAINNVAKQRALDKYMLK